MTGPSSRSRLDGPGARLIAISIALAGMAFLAWLHRDDIFPSEPDEAASADPRRAAFNACYRPQAELIDKDAESGEISAEQARLFKSRAEAFCADQADKGAGTGPSLPLR